MILCLDAGNSRLKWRWFEGGRPGAGGSVVHRGVPAASWLAALAPEPAAPAAIWVANVAGAGLGATLAQWARDRYGQEPRFATATAAAGGVQNGYAEPGQLGVDRWLALVAARARSREPCVVALAGTALTVDALDGAGHHRGGWIVAGYELGTAALLAQTAGIATAAGAAPPLAEAGFGRNTAGAVDAGACQALAAAVDRAVALLAAACGAGPRLYLGGGDAGRLAPLVASRHELAPELVLEGLAAVAMEAR